jgi:molecular chaperone DnaJ
MPVLNGYGRGDHRVVLDVLVPRRLTDEQRRLLQRFDETSGDETYTRDEGFFEKLKHLLR